MQLKENPDTHTHFDYFFHYHTVDNSYAYLYDKPWWCQSRWIRSDPNSFSFVAFDYSIYSRNVMFLYLFYAISLNVHRFVSWFDVCLPGESVSWFEVCIPRQSLCLDLTWKFLDSLSLDLTCAFIFSLCVLIWLLPS